MEFDEETFLDYFPGRGQQTKVMKLPNVDLTPSLKGGDARGDNYPPRLLAEGRAISGRNAEHPFISAILQTLSIGEDYGGLTWKAEWHVHW